MNKPIDANALRERIEGLYQGVDLTQDDKKILINEQRSISMYEFRESQSEHDKANFSKTMSEVAAERNQDPTYKENHLNGVRQNRDNTYQAETNARPEVKAKISKALAGKPKTKEHKQALKSTTTNRYGNADYEAAHKAGLAKRDKPFHAGEYGIFQSRSEAAKYAAKQGLKNALKKFEAWSKSNPESYYFINQEK